MKRNRGFLIALIFILIYPGCSGINLKDFITDGNLKLEPLKADISCNYYFFSRLDVIRQVQQFSTYSGGRSSTTYVPVEYHILGTDLGNGLFVDLNGNLSIDLFRLMKIPENKNFKIIRSRIGLMYGSITMEKIDNKATIDDSSPDSVFQLSKDRVLINYGKTPVPWEVSLSKNSINFDPNNSPALGLYGKWGMSTIEKTSTGTREGDYAITLSPKDKSVNLIRGMKIVKDGESLKIYRDDILMYTYVHNQNGYFLYDKDYNGYRIEILPSEIKVSGGMWGSYSYSITYL